MRKKLTLLLLLPVFMLMPALSQPAQPIIAQWEAHQIKFRYSGFTSHYTCSGLISSLKKILVQLGARKDVRIESYPASCDPFEIKPFHSVIVAFSMPVYADELAITQETFPAEWQEKSISSWGKSDLDPGDCELMEQVIDRILPYLNVRDVKDQTRCIPNQYSMSSVRLRLKTLTPADPKELEPATKAPDYESHIGINTR